MGPGHRRKKIRRRSGGKARDTECVCGEATKVI